MLQIPVSKPALIGNEKEYVQDCLDSTWISSNGKYIGLFEKKFAEYIGIKHAVTCSNGTVALHIALLSLGIGPGDEVITPAFTFVSTVNAIKYAGADPIFADSEPDTWNIDPLKIENLITSQTKAIIAVPLYGHPCDMDRIVQVAAKYNLFVIEDAAEALGARYNDKMCGSLAHVSTFSFYGNKTITTGEGGMVVTNDSRLDEKIRILKGQGMDPEKRYWFSVIGYNYRMTNIQAAIGLAQLENVDKFIEKRRNIARWYSEQLMGIDNILLPAEKDYAFHSYWMYSILIEAQFGKSRDNVIQHLAGLGIETRPFFYPMHIMPVYKHDSLSHLKTAETIAAKGINLPTYYDLTLDDIQIICDILKSMGQGVDPKG